MGLSTLPTKTDGSIGRVKVTLPGSAGSPDLDYYVTAEEYERLKTALVDVCAEVGKNDGSTAGSLVNRVSGLEVGGDVLYDMPIATGSVGTPARVRDSGDGPSVPAGTPSETVVPWNSFPNKNALRLSCSGMDGGGFVWPINHGLGDLPESYILEVWLSGLDSAAGGLTALIMPMAQLYNAGGAFNTARGYAFLAYAALSQIDRETVDLVTTNYARVLSPAVGLSFNWPGLAPPVYNREPAYLRFAVRHQPALTPARWTIQAEAQAGGATTSPVQWGHGSVDDPLTQLNGLTLRNIGIGVFGTGAMDIDIARLRIRSLA